MDEIGSACYDNVIFILPWSVRRLSRGREVIMHIEGGEGEKTSEFGRTAYTGWWKVTELTKRKPRSRLEQGRQYLCWA